MKSNKSFLPLLDTYFTDYLPISYGACKNTIRSYKHCFKLLIDYFYQRKNLTSDKITFDELTYDNITDFLNWLEEIRKCSVSTRNQRLAALSSFSKYAQNRDFEAASSFRAAIVKIPVKKTISQKRAFFSREEVKILLSLPNEKNKIGLRDKVLLSTMYATGARAQEICDLTVGDIRFVDNGASVNILGKGGKRRQIFLSKNVSNILQKYIKHKGIYNFKNRHVFSSLTHEHMEVSCVEEIFKKYVSIAKAKHEQLFKEKSYSPHSMRHTTACHMIENGISIIVIKNFLGHSSLLTTQIYAEMTQDCIDEKLKEWNEKWFPSDIKKSIKKDNIPDFLKTK